MKQHLKLLVASLLAVALFATPAWAASYYWSVAPPESGDFWTATNWNSGIVPGSADYALIQNNGTAEIGQDVTISRLYLGHSAVSGGSGGGGTVKVDSGTLTVTGQVNVGRYSWGNEGKLEIASGAGVATATLFVGYGQDNNAGNGTVTVEGSLTFTGSSGIAYSGNTAGVSNGVLNVQNGGSVSGSVDLPVGRRINAVGTLNVTGDNSLFSTSANLQLGVLGGTGTVNVGAGGEVACSTLQVGFEYATAVANVNLNSGGLISTAKVAMGNTANPLTTLLNFNGGTLQATADAASFVEKITTEERTLVVVKSGGAKINSGIYAIGMDVALTEDAESTGGGLTKLGEGTLTLGGANTYTGATLVEAGTLALGAAGSIADSASIIVAADATLDVTAQAAFALADGQTLGGNGDVVGDVEAVDGSTIAPGLSIGTLTVTGDLTVGGTLAIEYNSDTLAIDLLNVSGALDLSGATLSFSDLGESTLAGEPYVFATYGTLAGAPAVEPIDTPTGYVVDYAYEGNKVALVLIPEPSALALLAGLMALLAGCRARR